MFIETPGVAAPRQSWTIGVDLSRAMEQVDLRLYAIVDPAYRRA